MEMEIVSPGGKKVYAFFKNFTVKTDQSIEYGGDESAPEPFDLFLASIGTCVGINAVIFCKKRDIPTEDVKIILKTEKNAETKMYEKISLEIDLPNEFPKKYREAIKRAVDLCSVKKHIFNPPEFDISVSIE